MPLTTQGSGLCAAHVVQLACSAEPACLSVGDVAVAVAVAVHQAVLHRLRANADFPGRMCGLQCERCGVAVCLRFVGGRCL